MGIAAKVLLGLTACAVVPVGALYLVNIPDRDPLPGVTAWLQATPEVDGANGYYALWALGADATADVLAEGKDFVRWYNDSASAGTLTSAALEERQGRLHKLKVSREPEQWCDWRKKPCLQALSAHEQEIRDFATDHQVLMDRYRALSGYPHFRETLVADLADPYPPYRDLKNLAIAQSALAALDVKEHRYETAIALLDRQISFWRALLAHSDSLLSKMIAEAQIKRDYQLLAEAAEHDPRFARAAGRSVRAVFVPLTPQELDLSRAVRSEFQAAAACFSRLLGCMPGVTPLVRPLYQHNDTLNQLYENYALQLERMSQPANQLLNPAPDTGSLAVDLSLAYNPVGKIGLGQATPGFREYALRLHDLDGFMRLVRTQQEIVGAGIKDAEVEAFVAQAAAQRRDPYTDKPLKWDLATRELSFQPRRADARYKTWSVRLPKPQL
jgi:hypothetical protein